MEKKSADIELNGQQLLDMIGKQVSESYGVEVTEAALEMDDKTKIISCLFVLKDRIGFVKVLTDLKAE